MQKLVKRILDDPTSGKVEDQWNRLAQMSCSYEMSDLEFV